MTNNSIDSLVASQRFVNDAATATTALELTNKTTISTHGAKPALEVRYDAGAQTYTLSTPGRSQSFSPADATATSPEGITNGSLQQIDRRSRGRQAAMSFIGNDN